jgi:predicted DNA-binding protein (UPF0251 family)
MFLRKNDLVLTSEEAIGYLKISKPTLWKHLREGRIKSIRDQYSSNKPPALIMK